jgi:hypothetical protein
MKEEKTFDYRNYIQSRLKEIDDLDERREARELLLNSLAHIFEWTEAKYAELEQRIQDELKLPWQYYNVFMTIIKRGDYDAINPFWHPVCVEDVSPAPKTEYRTVFLMADEGGFREFLAQGTVEGVDESDGHHIRFRIRTCERYGERMKTLYLLFAGNHIPWQTVHMGYAERFFDLVPEEDVLAGKTIRFLWGKWEKYVHEDMLLLWNIERFMMQSQEYRHPCLDEVVYEHIYYLGSDRDEMDGYLVETNDDILSVRFEENKILIKTQQETLEDVFLYRLYQGAQGSSYGYHFPVLSNCKKDNLAVRYLQETGNFIQTPMELYRKIEELSAGYPVRVTGYEITDHVEGAVIEGDMNRDIGVQIFSNDKRKILLFRFHREAVTQDAYLYESQIRYILSQLQLEFLEYRCMGVWV